MKQGEAAAQSERKICGDLHGDPAQVQRSELCGERTSDGMNELSRISGSEEYAVREDESRVWGRLLPNKITERAEMSDRRIMAPR